MLTFYPEFEAESPPEVELLFLLDLSCSMKVSSSVVFFSLCLRLCCWGGGSNFVPYASYTGVRSGIQTSCSVNKS